MTEKTTETEEYTWIEHELGTYRIEESTWGTFNSIHKDGTAMVTAPTAESCKFSTESIHMPFYYGADTSDIKVTSHDVPEVVDL